MILVDVLEFFRQPRVYHATLAHFNGVSAAHRLALRQLLFLIPPSLLPPSDFPPSSLLPPSFLPPLLPSSTSQSLSPHSFLLIFTSPLPFFPCALPRQYIRLVDGATVATLEDEMEGDSDLRRFI